MERLIVAIPPERVRHRKRGATVLHPEKGDFLVSAWAAPSPDYIVETLSKKTWFNPDALQEYLGFLELVILNERIILGYYDVFEGLNSRVEGSEAFEAAFTLFRVNTKHLDLEEGMYQQLHDQGILYESNVSLVDSEISPASYAERYLPFSDRVRKHIEDLKESSRDFENDIAVLDAIGLVAAKLAIGVPLYLSEAARRSKTPILLSREEMSALADIENIELSLRNSVIGTLKERLDAGVNHELKRLSKIGIQTIFPETPIAWQIIKESSRPADLLKVAIQLRGHYRSFRKEMIELESELTKDDISLSRKIKLRRELDLLAAELWPSDELGLRKETMELSELISIIPASLGAMSVGNVAKLANYILSQPIDLILRCIRRRKVRVLLRAREDFMKSKGWTSKLATIFEVPESLVSNALLSRGQV